MVFNSHDLIIGAIVMHAVKCCQSSWVCAVCPCSVWLLQWFSDRRLTSHSDKFTVYTFSTHQARNILLVHELSLRERHWLWWVIVVVEKCIIMDASGISQLRITNVNTCICLLAYLLLAVTAGMCCNVVAAVDLSTSFWGWAPWWTFCWLLDRAIGGAQ
jgi:hypothetical protein